MPQEKPCLSKGIALDGLLHYLWVRQMEGTEGESRVSFRYWVEAILFASLSTDISQYRKDWDRVRQDLKVDGRRYKEETAKWRDVRQKVQDMRFSTHLSLSPHLEEIERSSKEAPCPECKRKRGGESPEYDCGCGEGYKCCDFYGSLQDPCPICGYHGIVWVAPEGTPQEDLQVLNEDNKRGLPCDGEGGWPKSRFFVGAVEEVDPDQGNLRGFEG